MLSSNRTDKLVKILATNLSTIFGRLDADRSDGGQQAD